MNVKSSELDTSNVGSAPQNNRMEALMNSRNLRARSIARLLFLCVLAALIGACNGGSSPSYTQPPPTSKPLPTPTEIPPPTELPDFAIVGHWRDPAEPYPVTPNTTVYFHIQVQNIGNAPYQHNIAVQGPGNHMDIFKGLMPGETKEAVVAFLVGCPDHGCTTSDLYFRVDPDNVTKEWNENNNTLGPLTVVYGGG